MDSRTKPVPRKYRSCAVGRSYEVRQHLNHRRISRDCYHKVGANLVLRHQSHGPTRAVVGRYMVLSISGCQKSTLQISPAISMEACPSRQICSALVACEKAKVAHSLNTCPGQDCKVVVPPRFPKNDESDVESGEHQYAGYDD